VNLRAPVLDNAFVRLEPLAEAHREALRAACAADEDVWTALYPYSMAGPHFDPSWDRIQGEHAAGRALPFAVIAGGECVGCSGYLNIETPNRALEIGGTYYRPGQRGTAVNPAAKHLLLGHAFASGARRVRFCVDAINARSRAAMRKLGAVEEGIMRQDRVCWTGRVRDTVVFSVLADEWPAVSAGLLARLER
jgi:RimJ/RimL family protein N-acetyltransferase